MAAQNSAPTPKRKPRGKPFTAGDARINKGGRPEGFGARIREVTQDGAELVTIALAVARGKLTIEPTEEEKAKGGEVVEQVPTPKERLAAVAWLADRGWGKAEQPLVGPDGAALSVSVSINRTVKK